VPKNGGPIKEGSTVSKTYLVNERLTEIKNR